MLLRPIAAHLAARSILAALLAALPAIAAPLAYEPTLSPDGQTIAFVSAGDLWQVSAQGGEAQLLVAHPATESRPIFSPDGKKLLFASSRSGNGDLYLLDLSSNQLQRLTWDDRAEVPSGWSADGRYVYFHSGSHDIQRMNDVYRLAVDGGMPLPVAATRYSEETYGVPSPDGKQLALLARGFGQWWRKGGAHIDRDELWLAPHEGGAGWQQLTPAGMRDAWPQWLGDQLYVVRTVNGQENLWRVPAKQSAQAQQISQFKDGRMLWPSLAANGKTLAFERDFQIWTLDLASGVSKPLAIQLKGSGPTPAFEKFNVGDKLEEFRLSPDGKRLAFVARGELFVAQIDGSKPQQLTRSAAAESQLQWSPDGKQLLYVSLRDGVNQLYLLDLASRQERRLSQSTVSDAFPRFSPDGKQIAWLRNGKELRLIGSDGSNERKLADVQTGRPPIWADAPLAWSPDGQQIAVVELGHKLLANVGLVHAKSGNKQQISQLASPGVGKKLWFRPEEQGYGQDSLQWAGDGRSLLWRAFQHSEQGGRLVRIELAPPAPLGADGEPQATPFTIDAAYARSHGSLLPLNIDSQYFASRDGKTLALVALVNGQPNIWRYSAGEAPRQLSFSSGTKHFLQLDPEGKQAFYLDGSKLQSVALDGGAPRTIALQAEVEVDFQAEKQAVFEEAWLQLRDFFFDPAMRGQDWPALKARFQPWISASQTRDETRRVISLMLGELDSSHLGITPPRNEAQTTLGRLALDVDRTVYERDGKLQISSVLADGPAAQAGMLVGDVLMAIDGRPLGRGAAQIDSLLDGKIGKPLRISLLRQGKPLESVVKPIGFADEGTLRYKAWVAANRAEVKRLSGGKLDYVHLMDMREASLDVFHLDLDAEVQAAQGLVLDARNNYGGMVDSWTLDTLGRKSHYSFHPRQLPSAPGRTAVGQQALEKPSVLLTNKITLSDGEVLTEGYRALKLGKVVGEPGAGWVIFTSFKLLVDGSFLRLPFARVVSTTNGDDLEAGPRPVDVPVASGMGEQAGQAQLREAVRLLQ